MNLLIMLLILLNTYVKAKLLKEGTLFLTVGGFVTKFSQGGVTMESLESLPTSIRYVSLFTIATLGLCRYAGPKGSYGQSQYTMLNTLPNVLIITDYLDRLLRRFGIVTFDDILFFGLFLVNRTHFEQELLPDKEDTGLTFASIKERFFGSKKEAAIDLHVNTVDAKLNVLTQLCDANVKSGKTIAISSFNSIVTFLTHNKERLKTETSFDLDTVVNSLIAQDKQACLYYLAAALKQLQELPE